MEAAEESLRHANTEGFLKTFLFTEGIVEIRGTKRKHQFKESHHKGSGSSSRTIRPYRHM